jgi:hypothetical protein
MSITRRTFTTTALAAACTPPPVHAAGALLAPPEPQPTALAIRLKGLTAEEREIVETVARCSSTTVDRFTVQQINLVLAQAEALGEI